MSAFEEKLLEEYRDQCPELNKADEVVLYGNSVIASFLKTVIRDLGWENFSCPVFDSGRFIGGETVAAEGRLVVFLCSMRAATRRSMAADAARYFPEAPVYDFFPLYYRWITKSVHREIDSERFAETLFLCRKEEAIPNIDSINTLYCNLNCKECSNGIPYRKDRRRIPVESQIRHLNRITDKMAIAQCNFQGGEVFTDVDFPEFLYAHSRNSRLAVLTIATNATILPPDNVFRTIRRSGAMIRISDYGTLSVQKERLIRKCSEFNIPNFIFPMAEKWRKFGTYEKRGRSAEELRAVQEQCCFGTHDLMFLDDRLYCCLRTLYGSVFDAGNSDVQANTLKLDSDFSDEELRRIVGGEQLWRMCDYCDAPMELIEPAEQIDSRAEEDIQ